METRNADRKQRRLNAVWSSQRWERFPVFRVECLDGVRVFSFGILFVQRDSRMVR